MFQKYDQGGNAAYKAYYSDGLNTVVVDANEGDKAAELAAAVTAFMALYGSTPKRMYAVAFLSNYKKIFNAFYTMKEGFRTAGASPTAAQYRSLLSATVTIIYTLDPGFTTEFDTEKTALISAGKLVALAAAPNYFNGISVADCGSWHLFLNGWLGPLMGAVPFAKIVNELD